MKKGFTLSEVLITLSIVGVVAAIVLPSIIDKYHKMVWVNQLKQEYSMISEGFKKMMADDGVSKLSETDVFSSVLNGRCTRTARPGDSSFCTEFFNKMKKYFDITYIGYHQSNYNPTNFYGTQNIENHVVIIFKNGSMIQNYDFYQVPTYPSISEELIKSRGGRLFNVIVNLTLDVNGYRGPNKEGRDIFKFVVDDKGVLFPLGSEDYKIFVLSTADWHQYCVPGDYRGGYCTARIIEEGWKMNY